MEGHLLERHRARCHRTEALRAEPMKAIHHVKCLLFRERGREFVVWYEAGNGREHRNTSTAISTH